MAPNFQSSQICPFCKRPGASRILYGYPTRFDYSQGDAYGGDVLLADSHSHCCFSCNSSWLADGCQPLLIQFPERCHFCDDQMSDLDKFTYQTEYESWNDQGSAPFMLEHSTFTYDPLPTCSPCRKSIQTNRKALENDKQKEEFMRRWTQRVLIVVSAIMILVGWLVFIFGRR